MRKQLLAPVTAPRRRIENRPTAQPISPVLVILLLGLLVAPAAAQPLETVEVDANALVGVWKVDLPTYGAITFAGAKWGPLKPNYCRIDPEQGGLSAKCFNGAEREATV